MSIGPQPVDTRTAPVPAHQPRAAVIDAAWRALGPGLEVLSGHDGAPLRRTVKRILDPLVLRLRANPDFGTPVVGADSAQALFDTIVAHKTQLLSAAAWFAVLKQARRRLRITTGNAQELYFPISFELAVTAGPPDPDAGRAAEVAESVLGALHAERDGTAVETLNAHLAESGVLSRLAAQLDRGWRDVRADRALDAPFLSGLATVLGTAGSARDHAARQRVWRALVADPTPHNLGVRIRGADPGARWSIVAIGLSSVAPQQPPPLIGAGVGDRPLDRSVVDRVRATLRRVLDREELPAIPLLCSEEVDRACAPWGLLGEDRQATLIAGIELATGLRPLEESAPAAYPLGAEIAARLRKEAYVLQARRHLVGGAAVHPRQQAVIDELACFARPYLGRLWARLHGRDVWQESCGDVEDVRALLAGIARSVSLDHRQQIKSMLTAVEAR